MLNGFEIVTAELNDHEERVLVPMIMSKLSGHRGQKNAIKNKELVLYCMCRNEKVTEPRVRKIVEYIRQKHLIEGLIAKQFGYFIAESPEEILQWIQTMKCRRNAIECSINAAMRVYDKLTAAAQNPGSQMYLIDPKVGGSSNSFPMITG